MCVNPELEYWKAARRKQGVVPVGALSDKLAETKGGRLRIRALKLQDENVVRQLLDLMAEGTIDIIIESQT